MHDSIFKVSDLNMHDRGNLSKFYDKEKCFIFNGTPIYKGDEKPNEETINNDRDFRLLCTKYLMKLTLDGNFIIPILDKKSKYDTNNSSINVSFIPIITHANDDEIRIMFKNVITNVRLDGNKKYVLQIKPRDMDKDKALIFSSVVDALLASGLKKLINSKDAAVDNGKYTEMLCCPQVRLVNAIYTDFKPVNKKAPNITTSHIKVSNKIIKEDTTIPEFNQKDEYTVIDNLDLIRGKSDNDKIFFLSTVMLSTRRLHLNVQQRESSTIKYSFIIEGLIIDEIYDSS